jgi:hypothetical protein
MKIDRSNYEIWLIDWLDGNLNDQEAEQLRLFLNENPDIKAEAEDLDIFTLVSSGAPFIDKDLLKRSPKGISQEQFEYLSVASLENDLSEAQQLELEEIVSNNPAKREIFEQIGRLKLNPARTIYKHKNRLKRRTAAQSAIRISLIFASAAAVIALMISLYLPLAEPLPDINPKNAQLVPALEIHNPPEQNKSATVDIEKAKLPLEEKTILALTSHSEAAKDQEAEPVETEDNIAPATTASEYTIPEVKTIALHPDFELSRVPSNNRLVASNFPTILIEDEAFRSSIGRFIARNFREKLLKEETPPDSPLKGFEIAEAGVAGINKIFGWEMELDKKKNETGDVKSVSFSSRIIKFSAPVKKTEPLASSE